MLVGAAVSCWSEAHYLVAFDSNRSAYVMRLAPLLNGSVAPLLVTDASRRNVLDLSVLSRWLEPNVALAVLSDSQIARTADCGAAFAGRGATFALNPSPQLVGLLRRHFMLQPVRVGFRVFELEPSRR